MKTEILEVTPAMATKWLSESNSDNRRIIPRNVDKYALDMTNGHWSLTHQGIAFYKSGRFADGQHRLLAVVKSNCTVPMLVTFGIEDSASADIDGVRPRTVVDQLNISGISWVNSDHASVIKIMSESLGKRKSFSSHELLEKALVLKNSFDFAFNHLRTRKKFLTSAPVFCAVILAHYNNQDESRLAEFCNVLFTGVIESKDDIAAIRIREYLMTTPNVVNGGWVRTQTQLRIQRAIKAFLDREQISRVLVPSEQIFPIPDIF